MYVDKSHPHVLARPTLIQIEKCVSIKYIANIFINRNL